jgi:hypothetical protein
MPDMLAIVSKAVFEKDAGKAKLGRVLSISGYASASKHLQKLDASSRLFLVTVRPPKEALWLVAVLESPVFDGKQWHSQPNTARLTDISTIKDQLQFDSGKGIAAKPGALGMSLQTPRVLTPADAKLLLEAATAAKAKVPAPRPVNLAVHEERSPLPCLCKRCITTAPEQVERHGLSFVRAKVEVKERLLWFWLPSTLSDDLASVTAAVTARLDSKLKPFPGPEAESTADATESDNEDE